MPFGKGIPKGIPKGMPPMMPNAPFGSGIPKGMPPKQWYSARHSRMIDALAEIRKTHTTIF